MNEISTNGGTCVVASHFSTSTPLQNPTQKPCQSKISKIIPFPTARIRRETERDRRRRAADEIIARWRAASVERKAKRARDRALARAAKKRPATAC